MPFVGIFKSSRGRFASVPEDEINALLLDPEAATFSKTQSTTIKALYGAIACLTAITIFLLAIAIFQNHKGCSTFLLDESGYSSRDILPKGDPRPQKFSPTYNHSGPDSQEIRKLYSKYYITEGRVGIPVQDPGKYNLPPGFPSTKDKSLEVYLPTFLHQLHCLILLRTAWWDLRNFHSQRSSHDDFEEDGEHKEMWDFNHVEHCMDYLRQVIMCNADTTLEAPAEHENGQRSNVDGMNIWHQCWDMDVVWDNYKRLSVPFDLVLPYKHVPNIKEGEK